MQELYVVKRLDNQKASPAAFENRKEARKERNRLTKEGTVCVISRGKDHRLGESDVESSCLNTERTSRKRRRINRNEAFDLS